MAIAGLDLGRRRIGLAISDDDGLAVHPIGALERHSIVRDLELIRIRLAEYEVTRVVVGLPLNMDGSAGPAAIVERLAEITAGQTLRANHTLVIANARLAAQVARELASVSPWVLPSV